MRPPLRPHPFALRSAAVLALLVTASACSTLRSASDSTGSTSPSAVASEGSSTAATAAMPPVSSVPGQRTITVTATGRAEGTADSLLLAVGVEVFGASTGEALAALTEKATALTDFFRQYGIADADVQTTGLWAYPMYGNYSGVGTPTISGYQASETFSVRVDDLAAADPLLDGATFTITDALRLQGMTMEVRDETALDDAARTDAIARADDQATVLADAAGLPLGEIVSIDESTPGSQYLFGDASAEGIPFSPGTLTRTVQVRVTYAVG